MPKDIKKRALKSELIESLTRSLVSSGQEYERLIEASPDIVSTHSLDGTILGLNKAFDRITGYRGADRVGKPGASILHPDDQVIFQRALARLKKGEAAQLGQVRLTRKNGGYAICEFGVSPLYEQGKLVSFFAGYRDVTTRILAEEQLRREKDFTQNLIASSVDGIFAFDKDLRYSVWNPAMEMFTGIKKEAALGKRALEVFPHLKETGEAAYYQQALSGKSSILTDWPLWIAKLREQRFIETYFSPLVSGQGKVIGGLGVIRDITEYKAAKEALIRTEHQYRLLINSERDFSKSLIDSSVDGIFAFDKKWRYTAWNPTMEVITGLRRAEVLGKRPEEVSLLFAKEGLDAYFEAALAGNATIAEEKEYISTINGKRGVYETYFSPLKSGAGEIIGGLAIVRDITQYKQAEQEVKKSEHEFRSLVEAATDVICKIGIDGRFLLLNPAWQAVSGWTVKQGLKMNFLDLVHPDDRAEVTRGFREIMSGASAPGFVQIRIRRKDGQYRTIETTRRVLTDDGKITAMLCISRDITERRQAEKTLHTWAQIFKSIDIGIKITDLSGKTVQMVNPGYAKMHGYSNPADLVAAPVSSQYAPGERKIIRDYNEITKKKGYYSYESIHRRKDGSTFPVFIEATVIKDDTGNPMHRAVIVRDITQRKQLEQEIKEHTRSLEEKVAERTAELERRLAKEAKGKAEDEALLGSIGEGVIATDDQTRIVFINQQTETLLGWKAADVMGKKIFGVLQVRDQGHKPLVAERRPIAMAMSGAKKFTTSDYYYVRADGTDFPVALTTSPIILDGRLVGAVTVFRDITKEKEIDRVKSEFVSLASHQLRTPLATINWYAETLLSGKIPAVNETQKRYLDQIYSSSRRMARLVHDLLNVSRLEMGTFGLDPEPVKLPAVIRQIVSEMDIQIKSRQLTVTDRYDPRLPTLQLDPQLVHIVFQNLLTNAIKYTPPGGHIEIEIVRTEGTQVKGAPGDCPAGPILLCSVTDTGYGIPKEVQEKVFTKFFRAYNVKEKDQDGTGLGLYIVRSLVGLLHGAIWFDSPGKQLSGNGRRRAGTTFYVAIPVKGSALLLDKVVRSYTDLTSYISKNNE